MPSGPARRDVVQALPTELVRSCFRLLDFRARIYVSHVSRAWRAIALNDRFLWNEAHSPYTRFRHGAEMLDILLARSDPLPFSFSWEYPFPMVSLPEHTADIVFSNMHRMQRLYIKDLSVEDRDRLFLLPAPLLRTFGSEDTKGSPVHAGVWRNVEDLRIMSLHFIAAPQPFAAVRTFCCWDIDRFVEDHISVFSVFPALKTLRIWTIADDAIHCLSDPHSSMDEVSLGAMDTFETDYSPLLRSLHGLRVNRLCLHTAREAAGVVELFSSAAKGPWGMDIDERTAGMRAELREDAQDRTWLVSCDSRISFQLEPRIAACLLRLEALTGGISLLVQLHNLDGWSRSLPALRTITLQRIRQRGMADDIPAPRSTAPISMPLLNSLTLWLDGMTGEIEQLLETGLPALFPSILERVPHVTIEVLDLGNVRGCDLAPLTAVAAGVQVVVRKPGKRMRYAMPDDFA